MFEYVPTLAAAGVPDNLPLLVLKVAHAGLLLIDQVSARPSGSEPDGVNEYALPATTELAGEPETVGARLLVVPPVVPFGTI
jgi:hypothetical protein